MNNMNFPLKHQEVLINQRTVCPGLLTFLLSQMESYQTIVSEIVYAVHLFLYYLKKSLLFLKGKKKVQWSRNSFQSYSSTMHQESNTYYIQQQVCQYTVCLQLYNEVVCLKYIPVPPWSVSPISCLSPLPPGVSHLPSYPHLSLCFLFGDSSFCLSSLQYQHVFVYQVDLPPLQTLPPFVFSASQFLWSLHPACPDSESACCPVPEWLCLVNDKPSLPWIVFSGPLVPLIDHTFTTSVWCVTQCVV